MNLTVTLHGDILGEARAACGTRDGYIVDLFEGQRELFVSKICDACRFILARGTKPTLPEVRPLIDVYYLLSGNGAGGDLHIVLDDHNYERHNIQYCIDRSSNEETKQLGRVLLMLSNSQRRRM